MSKLHTLLSIWSSMRVWCRKLCYKMIFAVMCWRHQNLNLLNKTSDSVLTYMHKNIKRVLMKNGHCKYFSWAQYFVYKLRMCIYIAPLTTVNKFSNTRIYGKISLISPWKDFCLIPFGKYVFKRGAIKRYKKFKFWHFWEHLYLKSGQMPSKDCAYCFSIDRI